MPSRMDKYSDYDQDSSKRANRNQELYKTIYDEVEYTNVEGISIIEKNEKLDISKIRELIESSSELPRKVVEAKKEEFNPIIEDYEEKNYDIRDILDKAKSERPEKDNSNTQYDILKGLNLNENCKVPQSLTDEDLKKMIETITNNSKTNQTGDLLDDMKTIHDTELQTLVNEQLELDQTNNLSNMDKSFYTSSLGFKTDDFEQLKEMKDDIKRNNLLTKLLLFVLLVILVVAIMFLI